MRSQLRVREDRLVERLRPALKAGREAILLLSVPNSSLML